VAATAPLRTWGFALPEVDSRAIWTLVGRLGYDLEAEGIAMERLRRLDIEGCRRAVDRLLSRLDPAGRDRAHRAAAVLVLHDLLQRVVRILEPRSPTPPSRDDSGERWRLVAEFAEIDDPRDIVPRFRAALDRLLEPWRSLPSGGRPVVQRACVFIRENYHDRISLSSIAERLHVSPNYLSRQFRRETGSTLTSFIHRVRLEHARAMLADGGRSISEVAYRVGYQNYRDFHRNFVKYENVAPSQVSRAASSETGTDPAQRNLP